MERTSLWLALALSLVAPVVQAAPPAPTPPPLRLDDTAAPLRYQARVHVEPASPTFSGAVDLELSVKRPTQLLWLNGTGLTVDKAWFDVGGQHLAARAVDGGKDFVGFATDKPLTAGPARLHVEYRGKVSNNESRGLFHEKENDRWYAATQLEALYARRVFPCYDEPSFKVPWQITLEVDKDLVALSNTPVASEKIAGRSKTVEFAPTRPLPSYLIAFAVGPFELVDAGRAGKKGIPMRVAVPVGRSADAAYAAKLGPQVIEHLESYFGIPYPYDKLDIFTMPLSDVAMENVGLILAPENSVIAKPTDRSVRFERGFVSLMLHEMGHQWFGDLVTCAWWDDIWLNEAFASWIDTKLMEAWHPEWTHQTRAIQERNGAMSQDQLMSARQIRQPIKSTDDIFNAFDGITYVKGASVLGMFEGYGGQEKWRDGIRQYLTSHSNKTATSRDFVAAVSASTGRDLAPAMDTFIDQPGVPELSVELSCASKVPSVTVKQQRYLPMGSPGATGEHGVRDERWQIPICMKYGVGSTVERTCTVLKDEKATFTLDKASRCPDWLLANDGEHGYYRAHYTGDLLPRLLKDATRRLSLPELIGLLDDMRALEENGKLKAGDALAMVTPLAGDPRRELAMQTVGFVAGLRDKLVAPAQKASFVRLVQKLYGARARALGWTQRPGDDEDTRLLRSSMVPMVADFGEDATLAAEATKLARAWLKDRKAVSVDLTDAVLRTAAIGGDAALFDAYLAEAKHADRTDRDRLLRTLAAFRDPKLAERALGFMLNDEFDAREIAYLPFVESRWESTRGPAWEFVKKNFDALVKRVTPETATNYVWLAASFCDEPHRADGEAFFKSRIAALPGGPRMLAQSLEEATVCDRYVQVQKPSVAAFLSKY